MSEYNEYIIVASDTHEIGDDFARFSKAVTQRLQEGYELWGKPFIVSDNIESFLHQAMVKRAAKAPVSDAIQVSR